MQLLHNIIEEKKENINTQLSATYIFKEIELSKNELEIEAIKFVQKLGIRSNLMGYSFLVKAIMLSLESPHLLKSMTKELYPMIANYYGSDVKNVERNIRNAITSAYENDPERIQAIFYYKVNKPYISEVLSLAVETIKYALPAN